MKQLLFILITTVTFCGSIWSQQQIINGGYDTTKKSKGKGTKRNFSKPKDKIKRAPIEWYKIISHERDTTYLDTTLSIKKEYKFNYLRKDNFDLVSFVNVGRPYVQLSKQEAYYRAFPKFGSRARHFAFFETEDINYFNVPTPLTELYYKTVLEQGQQLDAFLTVNLSPNFNFSLAYKGVRSLGDYRSELTSTTAFRGTISYQMPNKRYIANLHFVNQSNTNEENGGLSEQGQIDFLSGSGDFSRRPALGLNLSNASNELKGKRFYIDHEYRILRKDTLRNNQLSIAHIFNSSEKEYVFSQGNSTPGIFGNSQGEANIEDKNELNYIENSVGLRYSNTYVGDVSFMLKNSFFDYGYNSIFEIEGNKIPNKISDNLMGFTGSYKNNYKGFLLNGKIESTLSGDFKNQFFSGTAGYNYKNEIAIKVGYQIASEAPEINKLLNQSNYTDYIWFNTDKFENTVTNTIIGKLESKRFLDAELTLSYINNYSYFSRDENENTLVNVENINGVTEQQEVSITKPIQADESLQLFKLKVFKHFKFRKFNLVNTLLYQQVEGNNNNLVYNVPKFVTRNTFYYQNALFRKKALFFQLGTTFRYYTKYNVDGYDPLLGDNYTQNTQEFGNTPLVDVFLNAKVRQTRIFLKLENVQNIVEQNETFLAPDTPTRDFLIRFGLVWNFFL